MRVFLTGASGFVGSYAVRALLEAGHAPRALVRDPARAVRALETIGVAAGDVDLVEGDMLHPAGIERGLDGCDAAIHAAAAIGVTHQAGTQANLTGTRNVVGAAVAHGLSPVVHISTVAVFVPPGAPVITAGTPLAAPRNDYGRSKVAAESYVRDLQDSGAPVTIVYPGGVCGPHQPNLDALMEGLAAALKAVWPLPGGGVTVIDVRDLAEALARVIGGRHTGKRWLLGGHYLTWPEYADLCDDLTGVRCRRLRVPDAVMLGLGSALDLAKNVRPFDFPLTRDAAEFMVGLVPTDDRPAREALDLTLRPAAETLADTLRWLAETGHLPSRRAGRLAPQGPPPTFLQRTAGPLFQRISGSPLFSKVGPRIVPPLDRALFRLTRGRVMLGQALVPSLVLTTTGAVSGLPRTTPLACMPEPDGSWIVVGSNFGREKHPAWTGNLLRNPGAEVTFRGRTTPVTARRLTDAERDAIWPRLLEVWPVYARYQERVDRRLRVFRLSP